MAKGIRVNLLAKELGVDSRAILQKLKEEGFADIAPNHMSTLSIGLSETVRKWFPASARNGLKITLTHGEWTYFPDCPLGSPGGFGEVFEGTDVNNRTLAIKRFYPEAAGDPEHRELTIAGRLIGRTFKNIIPIYDCGWDANTKHAFIVMPRATGSLAEFLAARTTRNSSESLDILGQIANGLEELGEVISRDLKPSNVLRHDGLWKISDFGLGRFADTLTTTHTMRDYMTFAYAAPELWLNKRPTKAADVYALGCVGYELFSGARPFAGPDEDHFREQHLNHTPPDLAIDLRISQLLKMCLLKTPDTRPSPKRVLNTVQVISGPGVTNQASRLAEVGAKFQAIETEADARRSKAAQEAERRAEIAAEAAKLFDELASSLGAYIITQASSATMDQSGIRLGLGQLSAYRLFGGLPIDAFTSTNWDVVFGGLIRVTQAVGRQGYSGRSANIWYAKQSGDEDYRFWEMHYMQHALSAAGFMQIAEGRTEVPFGIEDPSLLPAAAACFHGGMNTIALAGPPQRVDYEFRDEFFRRWGDRLAAAATKELQYPNHLPEQ